MVGLKAIRVICILKSTSVMETTIRTPILGDSAILKCLISERNTFHLSIHFKKGITRSIKLKQNPFLGEVGVRFR